ncbi:nucleotide-diphospho-sugar transferase [Aspergillus violaceofuscus CBS 115571]|uniref:Nucleotide-diphospho-sugar transferase n=1 Tax=Aspergillus violaceofuscus (strain CBS 115571) TaxID=1450538 RepID=A0A2V5IH24_ASPV1|nr:nucleotide-diphospho-sugar transferase [Aspergillus violaceofuscus CBS 115571]
MILLWQLYNCKELLSSRGESSFDPNLEAINWAQFAYVQYATDTDYLCNAVMLFESLERLRSLPERVLLFPSHFDLKSESVEGRLLRKARAEYRVRLMPIEVQTRPADDSYIATWTDSYTKLLVFNRTEYKRVISLDSDAILLQRLDDLFLWPPSPVAMPRAYWLDTQTRQLTSALILLQPSRLEFGRIWEQIQAAGPAVYDMEILNQLYRDSAVVLPHRSYILLTGEFRARNHSNYLGSPEATWDPDLALQEAKYLHFSDWPVPKPWRKSPARVIQQEQPTCDTDQKSGALTCRSREIWLGLYENFVQRRKV